MSWEPTNANDVRLTVYRVIRNDDGSVSETPEVAASASIVVDEFSIDTTRNIDPLHGISNPEALGMSRGNVEHEFSFTVMGEYYELLNQINNQNSESGGVPYELQIRAQYQEYRTVLFGAYIEENNHTVSDGSAAEHEFSGVARSRGDRQ